MFTHWRRREHTVRSVDEWCYLSVGRVNHVRISSQAGVARSRHDEDDDNCTMAAISGLVVGQSRCVLILRDYRTSGAEDAQRPHGLIVTRRCGCELLRAWSSSSSTDRTSIRRIVVALSSADNNLCCCSKWYNFGTKLGQQLCRVHVVVVTHPHPRHAANRK